MGCLYFVFDVKKQGKPIREVRTRYWKLREGENRLSGLLEGISEGTETFREGFETFSMKVPKPCPKVSKPWVKISVLPERVVYRSLTFKFDSGIPRVTTSGRFCDWTGSRGLHHLFK
ncbi:hypothetical protein GQ457_07G006570 [Hibiscus cannabinus]